MQPAQLRDAAAAITLDALNQKTYSFCEGTATGDTRPSQVHGHPCRVPPGANGKTFMQADPPPDEGPVNQPLELIVLRALRRFRALLPAEVELALELSHEEPFVRVHAADLEHALLSVCIVAWHSMVGLATQVVVEMSDVQLDEVVLDPDADKLQGGLPPRRYARLVVSNGSRVPMGRFHKLIPPPAQTDDRPASAHRLPLVTVREIIARHQGTIQVSQEPGRGTAFDIYLPTSVPLEAPAWRASSGGETRHIVYVDDYEAMRVLVGDTLPDAGFRVTCHESAKDALAALQADPFGCDAVVSDYRLQGSSGIELLKQVKLLRTDLPVIIISGYLDSAVIAKAQEEGAAFVISKANDLSELCVALHALLGDAPRPALVNYSDWSKL